MMIDRATVHRPEGPRQGHRAILGVIAAAAFALASCGSDQPPSLDVAPVTTAPPSGSVDDTAEPQGDTAFVDRMAAVQSAVTAWGDAITVADATTAAEAAANFVVGPNGPGYGDRNGDGAVSGETEIGLLSGLEGRPEGIAVLLAGNQCVTRDVLGGTAGDVAAGWAEMEAAIAAWTPDNNTMPSLASHPMRIVGWATFTIGSASLENAHEYAGHAQLHVDVASAALDC
ncbi:MAG: hypothetical protein ACI8TP_003984 [Acidimicrobiales bacterium]|jgi:hypothetical protein